VCAAAYLAWDGGSSRAGFELAVVDATNVPVTAVASTAANFQCLRPRTDPPRQSVLSSPIEADESRATYALRPDEEQQLGNKINT
jgi:hypothetical protein